MLCARPVIFPQRPLEEGKCLEALNPFRTASKHFPVYMNRRNRITAQAANSHQRYVVILTTPLEVH